MSNVEFDEGRDLQYSHTQLADATKTPAMVRFLRRFGVTSDKLATMILIAVACIFFLLSIIITVNSL